MAALREQLAALRPGLEVIGSYLDVESPPVAGAVRELAARGRSAVVVPLVLSAGYHVRVDIAGAVAAAELVAAGGGSVRAARPLGPDRTLVGILVDRLTECGTGPADAVLLAAAGSSDPRARRDVERTAAALGRRLDRPVTACYLSAAEPNVSVAVTDALTAARGRPDAHGHHGIVSVATYLLSPGVFADRLVEIALAAGAGRVAAPLAGSPALARLALRRYDEASSSSSVNSGSGSGSRG
jgi:sirohydrochlorin ferrochelatase